MRVAYCLLLFVLLINVIRCEEHLYAHGPFGKAHLSVDIPHPFNCNGSVGLLSRLIQSTSVTVMELNVSVTNYSNGDTLVVSWTPLSNSCADDFIGVYFVEIPLATGNYSYDFQGCLSIDFHCPFLGACDYVDFEFVTAGQNNSTWHMINLRRQLEFRYYSRDRKCNGQYGIVARSSVVQPSNANEPTQIHLAFGDQIDQIYVSYVTNSTQVTPQCQYGLMPTTLNFRVSGTTITYNASDMCEGKANQIGPQNFIHPGYMHTILLKDLRPSTTYFYRVGNDQHGWSSIKQFTNRPSTTNDVINLIAYGDMGLSPLQSGAQATIDRVLARVISNNVTAVLHIGDISYARGTAVLWEGFMTQIEATASRVPYMVGIGNHEYDHVTGGDKDPSGAPGPGGFRPSW